jgi:hypothetical protein
VDTIFFVATEPRSSAPATSESPAKKSAKHGSSRVDGPHGEGSTGTKSAIRDIIRRYRETFERLAR